jgi:hypothetical protein
MCPCLECVGYEADQDPDTSNDLFTPAPEGQVWVCAACGKTSPTKAPTRDSTPGWDEACMMGAVLCYAEKKGAQWVAVTERPDFPTSMDES